MADLPRLHDEIARTAERIAPHILRTPLLQSPHIDGMDVHLKLESEQHTGSFKARGALNRLLSLTAQEREISAEVVRVQSYYGARTSVARLARAVGLQADEVWRFTGHDTGEQP